MAKLTKQKRRELALLKRERDDEKRDLVEKLSHVQLTLQEQRMLRSTKHFHQATSRTDRISEDIARSRLGLPALHTVLFKEVDVDDSNFKFEKPCDKAQDQTKWASKTLRLSNIEHQLKILTPAAPLTVSRAPVPLIASNLCEHTDQQKQYDNTGNVIETSHTSELLDRFPELRHTSDGPGTKSSQYWFSQKRPDHIKEFRDQLPAAFHEFEFVDALLHNDVVIVSGATGSGKSTQMVQFVLENGFTAVPSMYTDRRSTDDVSPHRKGFCGRILVTEPRRLAATGVCTRVSEELGYRVGSLVGYAMRQDVCYDTDGVGATRMLFLTEGVLLKMISEDFLLPDVSVIVLDEAHERSVNVDVLLGLLSRIILLRRRRWNKHMGALDTAHAEAGCSGPLKLIIMSATLRLKDFVENKLLFTQPPAYINVSSRTFPVALHFEKATDTDYVTAASQKAIYIHRFYDAGHILVFLPGQADIRACMAQIDSTLCRTREASKNTGESVHTREPTTGKSLDDGPEEDNPAIRLIQDIRLSMEAIKNLDGETVVSDNGNYDEYNGVLAENTHDTADQIEMLKIEHIGAGQKEDKGSLSPYQLLPLYGSLNSEQQSDVFTQAADTSRRLIIVATNIAEASLTIPNIRYVVDSGRTKQRIDSGSVVRLAVQWESKANADQRAGRAGRTSPGHCFRLYSPGLFNKMADFPKAEIERLGVEQVVLLLLKLGIGNIEQFPFPTHPGDKRISEALHLLLVLGAIEEDSENEHGYVITHMGLLMSLFPTNPRLSRAIVSVCMLQGPDPNEEMRLVAYTCLLASVLYANLFESTAKSQQLPVRAGRGDFVNRLFTLGAFSNFKTSELQKRFCDKHNLRYSALEECGSLAAQLLGIVLENELLGQRNRLDTENDANASLNFVLKTPPTDAMLARLEGAVTMSFIDHIAIRSGRVEYEFDGVSIRDILEYDRSDINIEKPASNINLHTDSLTSCDKYSLNDQQRKLFLQYKEESTTAYVGRNTECFISKVFPDIVSYLSVDAQFEIRGGTDESGLPASVRDPAEMSKALRINCFLGTVQMVDRSVLLPHCGNYVFSVSEPKSVFYNAVQDEIEAVVDVYYTGMHERINIYIGESSVRYPGNRFTETCRESGLSVYQAKMLSEEEYLKMFVVMLMNGDIFAEFSKLRAHVSQTISKYYGAKKADGDIMLHIRELVNRLRDLHVYSVHDFKAYLLKIYFRDAHPDHKQVTRASKTVPLPSDILVSEIRRLYESHVRDKAVVMLRAVFERLILAGQQDSTQPQA